MNICPICNKEFEYESIFCSNKCKDFYSKHNPYKIYLEHQDSFCKPYYSPKNFKKNILKEQNNKCAICNIKPIWNNKELHFVLDHIDGDSSNNKRNNLRMICPNCDSQLNTYKSKNKNSARRKYWKNKRRDGGVGLSHLS